MPSSYFVYAAYDNKYKSAAEACSAHDWIFVGKTKLLTNEQPALAAERVVTELTQSPDKYGKYLHESLVRSKSFHVQYLSTWTPTIQSDAAQYPTDAEIHWITQLEAAGGRIKNLAA